MTLSGCKKAHIRLVLEQTESKWGKDSILLLYWMWLMVILSAEYVVAGQYLLLRRLSFQ